MVKMTLLLFKVSFMGTLNEGTFISFQVFAGIARESVYTILLLHDESRRKEVNIRTDE
jgi:hypothetical protein